MDEMKKRSTNHNVDINDIIAECKERAHKNDDTKTDLIDQMKSSKTIDFGANRLNCSLGKTALK